MNQYMRTNIEYPLNWDTNIPPFIRGGKNVVTLTDKNILMGNKNKSDLLQMHIIDGK